MEGKKVKKILHAKDSQAKRAFFHNEILSRLYNGEMITVINMPEFELVKDSRITYGSIDEIAAIQPGQSVFIFEVFPSDALIDALSRLESQDINVAVLDYFAVARCVCEFGVLGKTETKLTVKENTFITIKMKEEQCRQINQAFERKYETTFNISNYLFKGTEPILFCVNAVITPYWVVPLGKQRYSCISANSRLALRKRRIYAPILRRSKSGGKYS